MRTISTTIGDRGEVRLPPEVLELLGVGPHDHVDLIVDDRGVRITVPAPAIPDNTPALRSNGERATRRRTVLSQLSAAFAHESVEETERAVAAALAEIRAEPAP